MIDLEELERAGEIEPDKFGGFVCRHNTQVPTLRTLSNGTKAVALQCCTCGTQIKNLAKKDSPPLDKLALFDANRSEEWRKTVNARRSWEREIRAQIEEEKAAERSPDWWDEYNAFLLTDEWKQIRLRVLSRSGPLCESCRVARPVQVHHLTYDYGFAPPLFCLVAVCVACHDRITEMDRKRRADARLRRNKAE